MKLELDYEPRDPFIPFHQRTTRWAAMCCHRRAGKTVACIAELVLRAMYSQKKRSKYAYVGPFRQQAKEIAWEYLKEYTTGIRASQPRESDLRVTLINGSTIQIYGADNAEALRGLYFDGVILDEYGDWRPTIWGEIILPTLSDRKGWAVFIGTMKGKNHFWKVLERAKSDNKWFHFELKASESGLLSPEVMEDLRAEMTEAQWRQEMECDPNAAVMGTYYSELIGLLEREGRMGEFPFDPTEMVHVSADLGFSDSTAFWFWQVTKDGPVLIDYEESDGQPLEYYIKLLNEKPYEYADLWLPHDAKAKSFQTGRSTVEQLREAGLPCKVVPKLAVQHGIDAARKILPICRFDKTRCSTGIEALRAYRRQFNDKTQQYSNAPLHDWSSNGSDAFRYFALVTQETVESKPAPKVAEFTQPEWKLNELWEAHEKDSWRNKIIRI